MNGWMKEEVQEQTEHGLAGDVEITARKRRGRMEGGQTDWVDEEKKGRRMPGRYERQPGSQTWHDDGRQKPFLWFTHTCTHIPLMQA